jgi:glutamyl-tRNA reductase
LAPWILNGIPSQPAEPKKSVDHPRFACGIRRHRALGNTASELPLMRLFVAGLSYRTAPVGVRERLAVQASRLRCYGCRLKLGGNLSEVVLLSTCNRVEIYAVSESSRLNREQLFEIIAGNGFDLSPYLYMKEGRAAVEHLFSVVSGLDSMVIGETEITGQVKQAYQSCQQAKLTGRVTNRLFQTALQVAKEIRTETAIGRGATSVGSVAVELAERIFDQDLSSKTVMIIGAGKMGEACVRHLAKKAARSVLVTNRSYEKAVTLAAEFGGEAVPFSQHLSAMVRADIVVTSTGCPHTILNRKQIESVMPARRNRPLFLIDIAVPRDIHTDVEQVRNVYLYNVDHLEAVVRENVRLREHELVECRRIIVERAAALMARFEPAPQNTFAPVTPMQPAWAMAGAAVCQS